MSKGGMSKPIKIILITILAVIIVMVVGGYGYYYSITHSPLPQIDGQLKAAGLKDNVEIIRDSHGIPHIYAKNMHDLFFAQGYVQAQDRWWQMEFYRKTCGGRIEELTGKKPALINTDVYLRTLGLYEATQKDYIGFTPEERAAFDDFAAGVNAYISGRSPQQLSVNYAVLGLTGVKFKVEPWTAVDSLAFTRLMALDLGLSRDLELVRAKLYDRLGAEMAEMWVVPPWPHGQRPTILSDEDIQQTYSINTSALQTESDSVLLNSRVPVITPDIADATPDLPMIREPNEGIGSNSWLASGNMTASGKPLLANDIHLGILQPSIFYQVNLHCTDDGTGQPFDAGGFSFAPFPGIIAGHNDNIAWGVTSVMPDVNDFYRIKVNAENPLQYEWNGKWRDMTVREEVIGFGDGKSPIAVKVRQTHLGPIINDYRYDAKTGELSGFNNSDPLAVHWTGLEPSTIAISVLKLNKARNWDEFLDALKYWDTPSQNLIYADRQGNIGLQMPGRVPIRAAYHTGQVPVPGWTDEYEWKGYVPYEIMPRVYNPARSYMVVCNQEEAPPEYYAMLNEKLGPGVNANFGSKYNKWFYGYRAQRATDLLKQLAPNTVITSQTMQGDNLNLPARQILPALAGLKFSNQELADARDWLLKWDCVCSAESAQAALYNEFVMRLMYNTFQAELEGIAKTDAADREYYAINLLLESPDDAWWDDPTTKDKKETRDDILVKSFEEGYAAASAAMGKDRTQWKWGDIHKTTFVSNPLGASGIGLIESLVNQGPLSNSGTIECLNNTVWYAGNGNFNTKHGAAMRMIVDLTDFDKSTAINSTGQSGHPGSNWYGDQNVLWAGMVYRPMLWTRQQVDRNSAHTLILSPQ
ncbi:MAG: penicillin acylase family protein [Dehalococcoidia bacterium]|nr:penicillin acylase family protein [Dehalococcoidia bacterium]